MSIEDGQQNMTNQPDSDPGALQRKVIKLAVESYIDEAEAEKKKLLKKVEAEKVKNRDIKDIAERLAMEILRFEPTHELANATLALLLEDKMMAGQAPLKEKR